MRTVWKFELKVSDDIQKFEMPSNAKILHVAMQGRTPCLWVEIDKSEEMEERRFKIYGTGYSIKRGYDDYRGTCVDDALSLVWHIYEVYG